MKSARDEFLAGAALAINQHAPMRGGRQRNLLPQGAHRNRVALQLRAPADFFAKLPVFLRQSMNFQRIFDDQNNFFQGKRLLDEVECAELGGAHGRFDAGMSGNHHDHGIHAILANAFQRFQAVNAV